MSKDKSMTDEDWNGWTEEVHDFLENSVDESRQRFIEAGGDADDFDDAVDDIQRLLTRGDKRMHIRLNMKQNIQNNGRDLPLWPKVRGMASSLPQYFLDGKEQYEVIMAQAHTAFYQVLDNAGISHHLMTRPSSRTQRDGAAYGSVEAYVKAQVKNDVATLKRAFNAGLIEGHGDAETFSITNVIYAPWNKGQENNEEEEA